MAGAHRARAGHATENQHARRAGVEAVLVQALVGVVVVQFDPGLTRGDAAANRDQMERIAAPFDASRDRPWPEVVAFIESLPPGGWVLDVAGGNGRHSVPAARAHRAVALDVAPSLVERAGKRAAQVQGVIGDMGALPIGTGAADHLLCVAGIHCVRGRSERVAALREMRRVIKPGGRALFTVWARDQPRYQGHLARAGDELAAAAAPPVEPGDVLIPWRHGVRESVPRYFHLYEERELRAELEEAGWQVDKVSPTSFGRGDWKDNWLALATA